MTDMMENQKIHEVEKKIPTYLYNRLVTRRPKVEDEDENIRTNTLAKVMPDLSQEQKKLFLERYMNIFICKF